MAICRNHLYNRPLPCPWPACENGSTLPTIEAGDFVWDRFALTEAFDDPLYLWAARGVTASLETTHVFSRAMIAMNVMSHVDGDGQFYHFTGPTGVLRILESGELWASEYRQLADKTELHHSLEIADQTVSGFGDELCGDAAGVLQSVIDSGAPDSCYVTSFSLKLDSRKHWLSYANNETGGAIGLEPVAFAAMIAADAFAVNISRIAYRDGIKKGLFLHLAMVTDELVRLSTVDSMMPRSLLCLFNITSPTCFRFANSGPSGPRTRRVW
jgi:hypothetical protein